MSFWTQIEADFQSVVTSAEGIPAKLEALFSIRNRAAEMTTLTQQVTAIIDDGAKATPDKVTEILTLVGKL